jgi:hypothetical protein
MIESDSFLKLDSRVADSAVGVQGDGKQVLDGLFSLSALLLTNVQSPADLVAFLLMLSLCE